MNSRPLIIDNYSFNIPLIDIVYKLKSVLTNGKLKDIQEKGENILVTCVNNSHENGMEKKPALNLYVGDDEKIPYGYSHCFVCDFHGKFEYFVAETFNSSVSFAKEWLLKNFEHETLQEQYDLGESIVVPQLKKQTYLDLSILDNYQTYCPYLATRKVSTTTAKKFNLRYDSKYRQIIFPVFNQQNNLLGLLRRSIDTKQFYIPAELKKPLYGLEQVNKDTRELVITEGLFDCLLGNQYGITTIATLGTPNLEQIEQINKLGVTTIYLMFDNDIAGQDFNDFFHQHLFSRFLILDVNIPKPYKDIGDLDYDTFWKCIKNC